MLISACNNINHKHNVSAGDKGTISITENSDYSTNRHDKKNYSNEKSLLTPINSNMPCWMFKQLPKCQSLRDGFGMYNFELVSINVHSFQIEPSEKQIKALLNESKSNMQNSLLDYYYKENEKKLYGLIKISKNKKSQYNQRKTIDSYDNDYKNYKFGLEPGEDNKERKNLKGVPETKEFIP